MPQKPRHIILLVADSLRYDSVYQTGIQLPYIQKNAVAFTEARAAGCWTLPATASIFTGKMPHEHGATAQTRGIYKDIPTLAEGLQQQGYKTYQVTANIATTDIFGLERGFDEVRRIWKMVDPKYSRLQQFLVLIGKPRLREKLFSKDFIAQKLSEDLEMSKTWIQHTYQDIFNEARKIIAENEARGENSFLFLNLMETHFPYHISPTFSLSQGNFLQKIQEIGGLYHQVNQTFLKRGEQNIRKPMLELLKQRQQIAYELIAPDINAFCQEMHQDKDSIVVFGADHGENFGESGWTYHFSNVTDAGNKVPLFYLPHDNTPPRIDATPISTRHLYDTLLAAANSPQARFSLITEPHRSTPIMSSYWYNNKGETHEKFKYNQICFLLEKERYLLRNNQWHIAPFATDYDEPAYQPLDNTTNPLYDLAFNAEDRAYYLEVLKNYQVFAQKIKF